MLIINPWPEKHTDSLTCNQFNECTDELSCLWHAGSSISVNFLHMINLNAAFMTPVSLKLSPWKGILWWRFGGFELFLLLLTLKSRHGCEEEWPNLKPVKVIQSQLTQRDFASRPHFNWNMESILHDRRLECSETLWSFPKVYSFDHAIFCTDWASWTEDDPHLLPLRVLVWYFVMN